MVDLPADSERASAPGRPAAADGHALGALDSLAGAEDVVRRLGTITPVSSWLFLRAHDDEWVVLAAHAPDFDLRPGDAVAHDHPIVSPGPVESCGPSRATSDELGRKISEESLDVVLDLSDVTPSVSIDGADNPVGAIVRMELRSPDGRPLARLAGIDPDPLDDPEALRRAGPTIELIGGLLASLLTVDLDRSRMQRRLDAAESAAMSDELTGLGNRRAFERAVEREDARCERFGHQAGVLVLDLDGLKEVNDRQGHAAGDAMIRRAAGAIRASVRSADQAFRVGGDEFAVILPEVASVQLGSVAERLRDGLGHEGVAASIGSAMRSRSGGLVDAVARADEAMYEAKRDGGVTGATTG